MKGLQIPAELLVDDVVAGECKILFPNVDGDAINLCTSGDNCCKPGDTGATTDFDDYDASDRNGRPDDIDDDNHSEINGRGTVGTSGANTGDDRAQDTNTEPSTDDPAQAATTDSGANANDDAPQGTVTSTEPADPNADWVEIELLDDDGSPISEEEFVISSNGQEFKGKTDSQGIARAEGVTPGSRCTIVFPKLDATSDQRE